MTAESFILKNHGITDFKNLFEIKYRTKNILDEAFKKEVGLYHFLSTPKRLLSIHQKDAEYSIIVGEFFGKSIKHTEREKTIEMKVFQSASFLKRAGKDP